MTLVIGAAMGLAVLSLVQLVVLVHVARSARVAAKADERVTQLTAALALLTDTAEEGFVNVAVELERLGARPLPARSSRQATTRRIAAAVCKGRAVEDVASAESLSESEVRLHLGLNDAVMAAARADDEAAASASSSPSILDDLESWMNVLHQGRRGRGGRHAAVRA